MTISRRTFLKSTLAVTAASSLPMAALAYDNKGELTEVPGQDSDILLMEIDRRSFDRALARADHFNRACANHDNWYVRQGNTVWAMCRQFTPALFTEDSLGIKPRQMPTLPAEFAYSASHIIRLNGDAVLKSRDNLSHHAILCRAPSSVVALTPWA